MNSKQLYAEGWVACRKRFTTLCFGGCRRTSWTEESGLSPTYPVRQVLTISLLLSVAAVSVGVVILVVVFCLMLLLLVVVVMVLRVFVSVCCCYWR